MERFWRMSGGKQQGIDVEREEGGGDEGIRRGVGRGPQKVTNVSVNDIWRKKQAESAIKLAGRTR